VELMALGVVTATVDRARAEPCLASWAQHAAGSYPLILVGHEDVYIGPVAAMCLGVERMLREHPDCEVIACFHDDLVIFDHGWDREVLDCFAQHPAVGLVSFGGADALGDASLYQAPYHPDRLQVAGYRSNTSDAEAFGERQLEAGPIVSPASFALVGRRAFWAGFWEAEWRTRLSRRKLLPRPWTFLDERGIVDHFYAQGLGCLARRGGWGLWYLPIRCRHLRGLTTDQDPGYQAWANDEIEGGDRGIWEAAHRIGWEQFKDVLPLQLS
jgi:hypothetical protein